MIFPTDSKARFSYENILNCLGITKVFTYICG